MSVIHESSLPKFRWDLTPEEIVSGSEALIAHSKSVQDAVAALQAPEISFKTAVQPLADLDTYINTQSNLYMFPQHVSTSKEVRDASTKADSAISAHGVESSMRLDVYKVLQQFHDKAQDQALLDPESKRLVERYLQDFKRNGLHLPEETRKRITELKTKISDLGIEYTKNLGEENTTFLFTKDQLKGMTEDFFQRLTLEKDVESGKEPRYVISLKYPEYYPVMRNCTVEETRKTLEFAFNNRCAKENVKLFEEILKLRSELAHLLGYEHHAAHVLEIRMAKTPKAVLDFLTNLSKRLEPLVATELNDIAQLKKEENGQEISLGMWDFHYYLRKREQQLYNIDQQEVKKYFPFTVVTTGLLTIYQQLLSLRFDLVPNAHVWHPDVTLYQVTNSKDGSLVGFFYLDLYPRDGKYGHAACFPLQPGCLLPDGTRQLPVAAMVANFTKPTADKESYLEHSEVETYFHEFGHVMHHICSLTKYAFFSGTAVERDFVEAPSQMLENWCWEEEPLKLMSKHETEGTSIPAELVQRLARAKDANAGLLTRRQLLFGIFDHAVHTLAPNSEVNTQEVLRKLNKEIIGIEMTPGTNFAASFGHLVGGYDAQYYGYLWSEVFSCDMFYSRFKKEGIMNPAIGKDYREKILTPGGSQDAKDMLLNFLGREPNDAAFLESKGIKIDANL